MQRQIDAIFFDAIARRIAPFVRGSKVTLRKRKRRLDCKRVLLEAEAMLARSGVEFKSPCVFPCDPGASTLVEIGGDVEREVERRIDHASTVFPACLRAQALARTLTR